MTNQRKVEPLGANSALFDEFAVVEMKFVIDCCMRILGGHAFSHMMAVSPHLTDHSIRAFSCHAMIDFMTLGMPHDPAGVATLLYNYIDSARFGSQPRPGMIKAWKIGLSRMEDDRTRIMVAEAVWTARRS